MSELVDYMIFIRHGQTDYNAQRRFQGQADVTLNDFGRQQVRRSGELLANLFAEFKFESIQDLVCRTSDLPRAWETSQIVANIVSQRCKVSLDFVPEPNLREFNIGDFMHHTLEEFQEKHPDIANRFLADFAKDPYGTCYPGTCGESRNMLGSRLAKLLLELENYTDKARKKNSLSIWSTHGAVIDALLELMEVSLGGEKRIIGNGDIVLLKKWIGKKSQGHFPKKFGLDSVWSIVRHYQVGDNHAAKIHIPGPA